jgi:hypothetical protein
MARLLIVSRSMALAMRLADQHEVVEHPADQLDTLLSNLDADVLVLDVGDPVLAVNTVNSLREADQVIPVLLVSGYQPEWEQVEAQQVDGVHVVPLPITRMALLHGVAVLTGEPSAIAFVAPETIKAQPAVSASAPTPAAGVGVDPASRSQPNRPGTPAAKNPGGKPATKPAGPASPAAGTRAPQSPPARAPQTPQNPAAPAARSSAPAATTGKQPRGGESTPDRQSKPAAPVNPPSWGIPPRSGETPEVTRSDVVEGVSYSTSITRPFDQEPRTGQFAISGIDPSALTPPRWARHAPGQSLSNAPEATTPHRSDPTTSPSNGNAMARRLPRLGNRPRKLQRRPNQPEPVDPRTPPSMGLVTDPLGPRTDPYGFPSSDLDRRLDADAVALVTRGGGAGTGFSLRTGELIRMLQGRASELYSVSDTAQVLAEDVIERADADAAAILVPDGPIWRVSGGVGLRPLERRLELEESHWLITEIGAAGRAVLIEDTDIIRQQLAGAPLAAWRHLLAVPVPDTRGIVVLARGKEGGPFTDRDLSAVIAPVREAAALLAQAVETRRLARLLGPLRESDGATPGRPTQP